jgi:hypothetical protein
MYPLAQERPPKSCRNERPSATEYAHSAILNDWPFGDRSAPSPNRAQPVERGAKTAFPMAREAAARKPARRPQRTALSVTRGAASGRARSEDGAEPDIWGRQEERSRRRAPHGWGTPRVGLSIRGRSFR